jgi:hypothetical protein
LKTNNNASPIAPFNINFQMNLIGHEKILNKLTKITMAIKIYNPYSTFTTPLVEYMFFIAKN